MRKKWLVLLVLAAFVMTGLTFSGCKKPEYIKIGIIGPMQFLQGRHHWLGAQMAEEDINAAGGVKIGDKTYLVKCIQIDTNEILSVDDAANAVERAITVDNVDFLVGAFRSEATLAMQDIAMDYKKIFVVCGASHTELSNRVASDYERYKYWFRVTPENVSYLVKDSLILLTYVAGIVREELGIQVPKVAVVIEQAVAGDPLAAAANALIPTMGMQVVGTWRPSPTATDVTAELTAIRDSGAHIIYTYFSAASGVPYARQWGELEIPACSVGINVEAQSMGFIDATGGYGNYELTLNTLAPGCAQTDKTIEFYNKFVERSGEYPTYNAGTYDAIWILTQAVERAGTLDPDAIVVEMEKTDYQGAAGRIVFDQRHDVTWGPGFVTAIGTQWQNGELKCVWPYEWLLPGMTEPLTYPGTVKYQIPPWVLEAYGG
ncbi:MAG: ABC transporter substrate-binding protein [Bacillota bacterium]|nr:MAG: ABC transporter substrate-binding protein [Bacillota bacterium]